MTLIDAETITDHDLKEIKNLIAFKEYIKWFRKLTKEEQKEILKNRWK